jgi:hypothetical protein
MNEVEEDLLQRVKMLGLPEDIALPIAQTILENSRVHGDDGSLETISPPKAGATHGYAVRDTDLELVKALLGALPGLSALAIAAATGVGLVPAVGALLTGLVVGGYSIYWSASRKGADLSARECAILAALKELNGGKGASAADVAKVLSTPEAEVTGALNALTEVTLRNGKKEPFAHRDRATGLWRTDA